MRKILAVARWEYFERVKSKVFLFSLILMPLIMLAMGLLPGLLAGKEIERIRVIGIRDLSGFLLERFGRHISQKFVSESGTPLFVVRPLAAGSEASLEEAALKSDSLILQGEVDGVCILSVTQEGIPTAEYRTRNAAEFLTPARIQEVLTTIVVEDELKARGIDAGILSRLENAVEVRTVHLMESGVGAIQEENGFVRAFFLAYVFLMMLFFLIFSSGQLLVRSVMEEKTNRVVEILVSSCSPTQLMSGKILGLSGLGFTQMMIWGILGLFLTTIVEVPPVSLIQILLLILYFFLGYLLYAAIFIAMGTPVTTEQEAQHVTSYLAVLLVIPLVLTVPAIQDPGAGWIRVLSYVPVFTSPMMALRLSLDPPGVAEILATSGIMVISIWIAMIAAGRIFRVAILSTGMRPRLQEIFRWVLHGY